jgi:hypothetical protein
MIGISDDYASVDVNGVSFYYGYEETNENGEWCFIIRNNAIKQTENIDDLIIKIPASNLEHTRTCEEALLCGIEKAIIRGVISVKKA